MDENEFDVIIETYEQAVQGYLAAICNSHTTDERLEHIVIGCQQTTKQLNEFLEWSADNDSVSISQHGDFVCLRNSFIDLKTAAERRMEGIRFD